MDYEKAYKDALERAKEIKSKILSSHLSTESCKAVSEYINEIIPELRESEDERIRKEIISALKFANDGGVYDTHIAYLEKQKEEKGYEAIPVESTLEYKLGFKAGKESEKQKEPHYTKRNALFDKCVENCDPEVMKEVSDEVDEMLQKEQKPLTTEEWEMNSVAFLTEMGYTCIPPSKDGVIEKKVRALMKEQKEHVPEKAETGIQEQKPTECIPDSVKFEEGFKTGRELGFREGVESVKHAEWNEEDKSRIKQLIHDTYTIKDGYEKEKEKHHGVFIEKFYEKLIKDCDKQIDWLEHFPERFNLQPKQEWSEEDIDKMVNARARKSGTTKSEMEFYRQGIKDTLKSLRPSWKPSEEQMKVLEYYMHTLICNKNKEILFSLYSDLKKLM